MGSGRPRWAAVAATNCATPGPRMYFWTPVLAAASLQGPHRFHTPKAMRLNRGCDHAELGKGELTVEGMSDMTPDYIGLLAELQYERDIRNPNPDSGHLRAFRTGWNAGAEKSSYASRTLRTLTWQNLGNRLGLQLGRAAPEEQERAMHILADALRKST